MKKSLVSVILPVYNEEAIIRNNLKVLSAVMESTGQDYEIIISEDGSTDKTVEVARRLVSEKVRLLHSPNRLGKGAAIRNAASEARGEVILFMDADLASNPSKVAEMLELIGKGADIVIGSRYHRDSKIKRSPIRYAASRTFNLLVNIALGSKLTDHQCGFKAFRKGPAVEVVGLVREKGWFWDTEFLVRAQRKGLKVVEIPLEWKESPNSKFNLVSDSAKMFESLVRFGING